MISKPGLETRATPVCVPIAATGGRQLPPDSRYWLHAAQQRPLSAGAVQLTWALLAQSGTQQDDTVQSACPTRGLYECMQMYGIPVSIAQHDGC